MGEKRHVVIRKRAGFWTVTCPRVPSREGPTVFAGKPGKCPRCGAKLKKKDYEYQYFHYPVC